jgi:hypothetical protein
VSSAAGVVGAGTETFTLLNGATVLGTPVTVNVASGAASTSYTLPAGTPGGAYTIQAVYSGTANFLGFTDTSHVLTVNAATATTSAVAASATFSASSQSVSLSATVTSAAGTVNEGTETFTLLNGTTVIGTPVTVNVTRGSASATYTLPAGTPGGTYTIKAVYNGTSNFKTITDTSHSLTVNVVVPVFQSEQRVTVSSGKGKKKTTVYQLNFSAPLQASVAQNPSLYHVSQVKVKRGKPQALNVLVNSASLNAAGTSVTLTLGKLTKGLALELSVSGLFGVDGGAVAPLNISL